jgi:gliding motility-associated-like protein
MRKFPILLLLVLLLIASFEANGQNFSVSISFEPDELCSGEVVNFSCEVIGGTGPFIYLWNFDDPASPSNTSTEESPSHTYNPMGCGEQIYSVNLLITDTTDGQNIQIAANKQVSVKKRPNPQLNENSNYPPFSNCYNSPPPTPTNPDFTINISNATNNTSCIVSDSYAIDWGDGNPPLTNLSAADFPIEYTYTSLGAFNLRFSCTGTNGCVGETVFVVKNESNPAIGISSSGNTEGCAPITFDFSLDMNKVLLNSEYTTYSWTFGDGSSEVWDQETAIENNGVIEHTYTESCCPAPYFTVFVTASNSCSSTDASVNGVIVWATGQVELDTTIGGCVGEPVAFVNLSINGWGPGCSNTSVYEWDFGNGNVYTGFYPPPQIYDAPGVYNVFLQDSSFCGIVSLILPLVIDEPPTAGGQALPLSGCVDDSLVVDFTNQSTGDNLEYLWTVEPESGFAFINNSDSSSTHPTIHFSEYGIFEVSLKTFNNCDEDYELFTIHCNDKPTANFVHEVLATCDSPFVYQAGPGILEYDNHGDEISSYLWSFPGASPNSSTGAYPENIIYNSSGTYHITLIIENNCGLDTAFQQIEIISQIIPQLSSDTALCLNSSPFLLNANPDIGTWNGAIVDASGLVNPSILGSFYLSYSGECLLADSILVTVNPVPEVQVLTPDTGMCIYDPQILLSSLPEGGYWQGPGIIYPETGYFSPQASGYGQFQIHYYYTDSFPGCTCTNSDLLNITVDSKPLPDFLPNDTIFCTEIEYTFTNNTIGGNQNEIEWVFSDGFSSNDPLEINHTFMDLGIQTISISAQSLYGCYENYERQIRIIEKPPDPVFIMDHSPENLCSPVDVNLSFNPEVYDQFVTFYWNFGNGTYLFSNTSFADTTITYTQGISDSTYYISLDVVNQCGTLTFIDSITVYSPPIAQFGQDYNWNCSPVPVNYINKSLGVCDSMYWDFGDGNDTTIFNPVTDQILHHSYFTQEHDTNYTTTIIVYNPCGSDTSYKSIEVFPNTLTAFFNTDTTFGCSPLTVNFTNYSSPHTLHHTWAMIKDDDTLKYLGENFEFTFINETSQTDTFSVQLWIDDNCSRDSAYARVIIFPQPNLNFQMSANEICVSQTVWFENFSDVADMYWEFGDGTIIYPSQDIVEHAYESSGNYWVSLIGRSVDFGCWDTLQKLITIKPTPEAFILADETVGCVPFTINLNADSSFNQLWDFGDRSQLSTSPQHTYFEPGLFTITLVSEYQNLCADTAFLDIRALPKPNSEFSINSLGGYPERVQFINETNDALKCEWLLPNGDSEYNCQSIEYAFEMIGTYDFTLVTFNEYDCSDSITKSYEVVYKGLFIPNAFTPNNTDDDIGIFKAVGIGLKSYTLQVFDTYGNLLWSTNSIIDTRPAEGWDGTYDGVPLQQDVYIWKAEAMFFDNSIWQGMKDQSGTQKKYGTVSLIR